MPLSNVLNKETSFVSNTFSPLGLYNRVTPSLTGDVTISPIPESSVPEWSYSVLPRISEAALRVLSIDIYIILLLVNFLTVNDINTCGKCIY